MAQESLLDTSTAPQRRLSWRPSTDLAAPRRALGWLVTPPGVAFLLGAAFVGITFWWLAVDGRVPDGDQGRHLGFVFFERDQLLAGHELAWFRFEPVDGAIYPPVAYVVGMFGMLIGGQGVDQPVIAMNLVFVPLLVAGSYGVGRIAYGPWAGVLAVMFGLASPMVMSMSHIFLLDLPATAMVAVSAWLLLRSDRFERRGASALAGLAVGIGLLTKQPLFFFVAPFGAALVLRGGWRNWRNLGIFLAVAIVVALPWYIQHWGKLHEVVAASTAQATSGQNTNAFGTEFTRTSLDNYLWYGYNFVNLQFLLPLSVFFVVGVVATAARYIRNRRKDDYAPELLVGALGSLLLTALWFGYQDPRYSLPGLVFVAVVGTAWITFLPRVPGIALGVATAAILTVNTLSVNLGLIGQPYIQVREITPADSADVAQPGTLRVFSNFGYVVGPARSDGDLLDRMRSAKRDGVTTVGYEPDAPIYLNTSGLFVFGRLAHVDVVPKYNGRKLGRRGMLLTYRAVPSAGPKPCARFEDGGGLYIFRGDPGKLVPGKISPRARRNLYCPKA